MINGLLREGLIKQLTYRKIFSGHRMTMAFSLGLLFLCVLLLPGCDTENLKQPVEYEGPARTVEKAELFYTEKEIVKVKMTADLLLEFQNGDREFPKGIYIEFFDDNGKMESTLRANHAFYFKAENQWRGRGKVEVKNMSKNEQLNTEELFWKPDTEKVYTDKFVTIVSDGDVVTGTGLDARQDMTDYTILHPVADFEIDEEE
jgi:LPS export ABC transporter protein LptC